MAHAHTRAVSGEILLPHGWHLPEQDINDIPFNLLNHEIRHIKVIFTAIARDQSVFVDGNNDVQNHVLIQLRFTTGYYQYKGIYLEMIPREDQNWRTIGTAQSPGQRFKTGSLRITPALASIQTPMNNRVCRLEVRGLLTVEDLLRSAILRENIHRFSFIISPSGVVRGHRDWVAQFLHRLTALDEVRAEIISTTPADVLMGTNDIFDAVAMRWTSHPRGMGIRSLIERGFFEDAARYISTS
ncbi:uncharacterized protein E0L32_009914 [Thyridium curvatum]|uniref:Uncharacterized protein n=1 Tax=Thyridium curvatum TaxID=1093900 RepID=A0A507AFZ0_9PEZI|nr:uncharacterized protein E0L32_009914 [Thyridium curvatum]TPX08575.1 hypothetical protein E0L32_009914 [Thyridium curvatum]